jgi:hypothetical protein
MIPIYGFLEGDTIGLLIFAYPHETAQDLINKLQKSASVRIAPRANMQLLYKDHPVVSTLTVKELGVQPLEHFFVVQGDVNSVKKDNAL